MGQLLLEILEVSIDIEKNISFLYGLFAKRIPEDTDFWWKLSLEEKNHASLLRSGKEHFLTLDSMPEAAVYSNLVELKKHNDQIIELLEGFENNSSAKIRRKEAFEIGLKLESSISEAHYQAFMNKNWTSGSEKIFKQLNADDKDHLLRIKQYMKEQGY